MIWLFFLTEVVLEESLQKEWLQVILRKSWLLSFRIPSFTPISGDVISDKEFWFKKKHCILHTVLSTLEVLTFSKSQVLDMILNILHSFPINLLRQVSIHTGFDTVCVIHIPTTYRFAVSEQLKFILGFALGYFS